MNMKKITVCGLKKDRKLIMETLQAIGSVELDFTPKIDFEKMDTSGKHTIFEKNARCIDSAIEIIDEYVETDASMLSALEGRNKVSRADYNNVIKNQLDILSDADDVVKLKNSITNKQADIAKYESDIESLKPWMSLDIPLSLKKTARTNILFGVFSSGIDDVELKSIVSDYPAEVGTVFRDKSSCYVMVVVKKEYSDECEEALRKKGFARTPVTSEEIPSIQCEKLSKKIEETKREIEKSIKKIKDFSSQKRDFQIAADYFRIRAEKYAVLGNISQSNHVFFVVGYIPEKYLDETIKILDAECSVAIDVIDSDNNEPVELENSSFASSFEGVLESFGLPKKGEFDPSTIMAAFYVFLFGLMLSDAAYGAIISIACFTLLKKFKNMEQSMKKSLRMFMYCGLSTLFWGVLFGGWFGDVVSVVAKNFFDSDVKIPALWFEPINDPMKLLLYSMLFGIIHTFTGLGIKGYMYLKDKDIKGFVCDVLSWFMLLIGLLIMLLGSSIFASLAGSSVNLGAAGDTVAKALAILGAVIILFTGGRESKNWGKRLAKGAYSLYDITSWLSDILSYSRLLALGLATAVIASVINQMGSMAGKGFLGAVVFIIVFIFGHTFNLAINLLGAYVHTNRLQYVEFFGKFYEGGGRKFNPFCENTKFVKINKKD